MIPSSLSDIEGVAVSAPKSPLAGRLCAADIGLLGFRVDFNDVYASSDKRSRNVQDERSGGLDEVNE